MMTNEFEKGSKFSFDNSIDYSPMAIVSKHVLKKQAGNISLFAFDRGEGLSEHSTPYDALVQIVDGRAEIVRGGRGARPPHAAVASAAVTRSTPLHRAAP